MSGVVKAEVVENNGLLPYLRPGELAPLQRRGRREAQAVALQDRSARLVMHGVELAQEVVEQRIEAATRVTYRAVEAHAVVEDAVLRSEVRAVTAERRACELEPGAIPQIVDIRLRASMQRVQLLEDFGQTLRVQLAAVQRW